MQKNVQNLEYRVQSDNDRVHIDCAEYKVHCTMYNAQYTDPGHRVQSTMYNVIRIFSGPRESILGQGG